MAETEERTGKCLCGAVKFRVKVKRHDDGIHADACHCEMCQRLIGGPLVGLTLEGPPIIEDERALSVYNSSDWAERLFCKTCGSNVFYRLKDGSMHTVGVGLLDNQSDVKLALEIFVDQKPCFYGFAQKTKKMTGAEVMAAYADGQSASEVSQDGADD